VLGDLKFVLEDLVIPNSCLKKVAKPVCDGCVDMVKINVEESVIFIIYTKYNDKFL